MIQAIAFDLDDTLLRSDHTIAPYTIQVLRRAAAQGIHVIPASGRIQDGMRDYVNQLGCASCYIAGNGSEIYAADHTPLMQQYVSAELAREVARFAAENDCYAQTFAGDCFFYDREGPHAQEYALSSHLRGVHVDNLIDFIHAPTPKLMLIDTPQRIAQLLEKGQRTFGDRLSVTCSKPNLMEICVLSATKGNALCWVSRHLHFPLENTMAFGDSLNDLSMLTAAGHGVAMGNAREDVKALVPHVCRTHDEDGVADYINQTIFQEDNA